MQKNIIVVTSEGATVVVEQLFVMAKLDPTGYAIIGGVSRYLTYIGMQNIIRLLI